MPARFVERLDDRIASTGSMVCVGLDPDPTLWPARFGRRPRAEQLDEFLEEVVSATRPHVAAYKAQLGTYFRFGPEGLRLLLDLPRRIGEGPITILDLKVNDIPNTVRHFRDGLQGPGGWDALTVTPWMGWESLDLWDGDPSHGYFVVAHSSNPGSRDLQDLRAGSYPLWHRVLREVRRRARRSGNAGAVVGATYPSAVAEARRTLGPTVPLLVPGIGAQAGDLARTVVAGSGSAGRQLLVNSSRGILYGPGGRAGVVQRTDRLKREIAAALGSARRAR
jgi:orotidine-5'-phosphate decarboxylase